MKDKKLPLIIGIILLLAVVGVILYFVLNKKITITFIDDSTTVETLKIKKGAKITLPDVDKEGYNFEGWYYNGNKVSKDDTFSKDTTIVGKWIIVGASTMIFTFDTVGGNKLEPLTVECDTEFHLPTPTKSGYKFLDWRDKNEIVISDETKLVCENIELKANWEQITTTTKKASTTTKESTTTTVKKEYTCPSGYTLDGTKCKMTKSPTMVCPAGTKIDGSLCINTSDNNAGERVCKEDTVSIDGKGHTSTGSGDYYLYGNSYGKCAYYQWKNLTTQAQCTSASDINHKTTWVAELGRCYAETKMGNYETVCASDYQFYTSAELSSKFGIHDNGKCLKKVAKVAQCDTGNGYVLTNNKCVKTIDATLKLKKELSNLKVLLKYTIFRNRYSVIKLIIFTKCNYRNHNYWKNSH